MLIYHMLGHSRGVKIYNFETCLLSIAFTKQSTRTYHTTLVVIHTCLNITKTILLNNCGLQTWLCLFIFRQITLKQFNSLPSIDNFSCLGGRAVTHHTITFVSCNNIYACSFVLLWFYLFVVNTLFVIKFKNSFCNVHAFSLLNILPYICDWL